MGLDVTDLSCRRGGRPILRDLSFRLEPGSVLLLRGPNGAGKSTLLRVLAGLLPPAGGSVRLMGRSLADAPEAYGEEIAYAGHLDAVKPQLTVAENLQFWAALQDGNDIAEALARLDLAAIADRPAHACSAGQRRRLGLARLLLAPRSLWLLDEPTVSLDAAAVAAFCALVRAHCAGGGIAVIATHTPLDLRPAQDLTLVPLRGRDAANPFLSGTWT